MWEPAADPDAEADCATTAPTFSAPEQNNPLLSVVVQPTAALCAVGHLRWQVGEIWMPRPPMP